MRIARDAYPARTNARAGTTGGQEIAGARGNFFSATRHPIDATRNRQDARCKSIPVQKRTRPRPWLDGACWLALLNFCDARLQTEIADDLVSLAIIG